MFIKGIRRKHIGAVHCLRKDEKSRMLKQFVYLFTTAVQRVK